MITLMLAHLRIAYMVGNLEVGNSEYKGHQDCTLQQLCFVCTMYPTSVSSKLWEFIYMLIAKSNDHL